MTTPKSIQHPEDVCTFYHHTFVYSVEVQNPFPTLQEGDTYWVPTRPHKRKAWMASLKNVSHQTLSFVQCGAVLGVFLAWLM